VVEVFRAVREDTTAVELPAFGVNGNGDGLEVNGGGELVNITGGDIDESTDLEVTTLALAFLVNSLVRVFVFSGDTVVLNEGETLVHKTSVASLVSVAA
jgi:hypothetical protein